jgi:hypothetical protein
MLTEKVGADKILFGSDMPFVNANAQIGKILYARISDEDKRKILGLNMANILRNWKIEDWDRLKAETNIMTSKGDDYYEMSTMSA